jgi:hypothetical protein
MPCRSSFISVSDAAILSITALAAQVADGA